MVYNFGMKWGVFLVALFTLPFVASAATTQPPSCTISTPPGNIAPGTQTRIIWYTENATHAYINGIGEVALQGYRDVRPNTTTTYPMTVTNPAGTRSCSVTVSVVPAQNQSLLYYNSPQPYVYSPNQIFWSPITPSRAYYDDYVTEEWFPADSPSISWGKVTSGTIDSQYIPGTSYTLENTYTYPNGDYYKTLDHCVAGLDCVTVHSEQGWAYTEEVVKDSPPQTGPTPTVELSQQPYTSEQNYSSSPTETEPSSNVTNEPYSASQNENTSLQWPSSPVESSAIYTPVPGAFIDDTPKENYLFRTDPTPSPFNNYGYDAVQAEGGFINGPSDGFSPANLEDGVNYLEPAPTLYENY